MKSLLIKINKKTSIYITKTPHKILRKKYPQKKKFLICDEKTESFLNYKFEKILRLKSDKKNSLTLNQILKFFFQNNVDRNSLIVILGGGKISDICGFACSIWMRGIDYIIIPTTFLSQIDASIGGKTAIDWFGIRNLIGSFHFPIGVIINPLFTLNQDYYTYTQAIGELFKYIIITDTKTSKNLYNIMPKIISRDKNALFECIEKCIDFKISIIKKDPLDLKGIREILNFGHTPAHAIESLYKIPHGDSVFYGCIFELMLSKKLGLLNESLFKYYLSVIKIYNPKFQFQNDRFDEFYNKLKYDKKNKSTENVFLVKTTEGIKKVFNIEKNILKELWRKLCKKEFS
ncbi:MAG: 3-dehydroquinate synthase [Elusimicrobiales bacterium]|nr:3-dehydroquinate synthase [Elusimicrobiales bacterium]